MERQHEHCESDVPSILAKDGVKNNNFENENKSVASIDEIIQSQDNTVSWSYRVVNSDSNSATIISQLPGEGNRKHYHPNWNEWWYILEGQWLWEIEGEELVIKKGEIVFIEKGKVHKITAIGDKPAIRLAVSRADVPHIYV
jgi:quercetin dioxygenase-like cupin family protein